MTENQFITLPSGRQIDKALSVAYMKEKLFQRKIFSLTGKRDKQKYDELDKLKHNLNEEFEKNGENLRPQIEALSLTITYDAKSWQRQSMNALMFDKKNLMAFIDEKYDFEKENVSEIKLAYIENGKKARREAFGSGKKRLDEVSEKYFDENLMDVFLKLTDSRNEDGVDFKNALKEVLSSDYGINVKRIDRSKYKQNIFEKFTKSFQSGKNSVNKNVNYRYGDRSR